MPRSSSWDPNGAESTNHSGTRICASKHRGTIHMFFHNTWKFFYCFSSTGTSFGNWPGRKWLQNGLFGKSTSQHRKPSMAWFFILLIPETFCCSFAFFRFRWFSPCQVLDVPWLLEDGKTTSICFNKLILQNLLVRHLHDLGWKYAFWI